MTVDEIIIKLERAWNAGDGAAFVASFWEDADFVDVVGRLHHGREVIANEHQKIFDTVYPGSRIEFQQVAAAWSATMFSWCTRRPLCGFQPCRELAKRAALRR